MYSSLIFFSIHSCHLWNGTFSLRIFSYKSLAGIEQMLSMLEEFNLSLENLPRNLSPNDHLVLLNTYFNFSILSFSVKDLTQSNRYLNRILNDKRLKTEQELYLNALLFQLILFLEKREKEFVDHRLEYLSRQNASPQGSRSPLAKVVIQFVSSLNRTGEQTKKLHLYGEFLEAIQELKTTSTSPVMIQNFDLEPWLQEKVDRLGS